MGCPLLTREGEWLAAVLATGPGTVLSHLSVAAHHGVRKDVPGIDVSTTQSGGRSQSKFRIHRVGPMHPDDFGRMRGIPCTSLPRALIDIAPRIGSRGVELAIAEAQYLKIYDRAAVKAAVGRAAGRPGVAIVRAVLATQGIEHTLTNRELEERFFSLTRRVGLPMPLVNQWVPVGSDSFKCDFVWPDSRLIVETDGRDAHIRYRQFEEDRRRDAQLKLAGWEVVRFTWRQVVEDPKWVFSVVRRLLEQRGTLRESC